MHPEQKYCVYILASRRNGTLYTGVTDDLARRMFERKNHVVEGFTKRYGVHTPVWFESQEDTNAAIRRKKTDQAMEAGMED